MTKNSNVEAKYFPILRGHLNELLAIRELVQAGKLHRSIMPIIEPLSLSSTLLNTLEVCESKEVPVGIIMNSSLGTFPKEIEGKEDSFLLHRLRSRNLFEDRDYGTYRNNSIFFYFLDDLDKIDLNSRDKNRKIGLIATNLDSLPIYDSILDQRDPSLILIPDETPYRRRFLHNKNRVLLADRFNKLPRNSDYLQVEDEPFSEDHLYFEDEGYEGFSDYSVIGKEFSENGFAPYAVALHIVYFQDPKSQNYALRIRHFVSTTNLDITNPAGKFAEAVEKLHEWNQKQKLQTSAIQELLRHYEQKTYPGLGTIKKLSIKHHLELMSEYFSKYYENM